jgi:hypothetical protein
MSFSFICKTWENFLDVKLPPEPSYNKRTIFTKPDIGSVQHKMRRFGMGTISMDIDELLDETTEIAENDLSFTLNPIEIDTLLEITRHW